MSARLGHYIECSRFDNSQLANHENNRALEELNSKLETAQAQFELQRKEMTIDFAKKLETNFQEWEKISTIKLEEEKEKWVKYCND